MSVSLFLTAGSNFTSGTLQTSWSSVTTANRAVGQVNALASANDFVQITGVQLEAGTTASDFEFLPVDVNLQRCQRYCYAPISGSGDSNIQFSATFASGSFVRIPYPTTMRALPTLTYTVASGSFDTDYSSVINAQLYDADDVSVNVRDFKAEAEL